MQRKCVLPWGDLRFYPNLYVILTGPPGRTRKGTAMDPIGRFLSEPSLGIHMAAESITREQLIRDLSESAELVTLADQSNYLHSSMTIFNGEIAVFFQQRDFNLIIALTDWFDCKHRWVYRTKNKGTDEITNLWINMLGATTPSLIQDAVDLKAAGSGFLSRIIFVYASQKKQTVPKPEAGENLQALRADLLHDLEQIRALKNIYVPNADFEDLWHTWYTYNDIHPPTHLMTEYFSGYCERRPTMLMKLSMILHAAYSDDNVITGNDLARAISLLEEVEIEMPNALKGAGQSEYAGVIFRIQELLRTRKTIPRKTLVWRFLSDVNERELDELMRTLEAAGFCKFDAGKRLYVLTEPQESTETA